MRLLRAQREGRPPATAAASCSRSTGSPAAARRAPGRLVLLRQRHRGVARRRGDQGAPRRPRLVGPPRLERRRCDVPAVVGSFPEPFAARHRRQAPAGARRVRRRRAARRAAGRHRAARGLPACPRPRGGPARGARRGRRCASSSGPGPRCADDRRGRELERGPAASGVYARSSRRRARARALDARGPRRRGRSAPGTGLVAATALRRRARRRGSSPAPTTPASRRPPRALPARRRSTRPLRRSRSADGRARRRCRWRDELPPRGASPLHAARAAAGGAYCLALARLRAGLRAPARARRRRRSPPWAPRPPPACGREVRAQRALHACRWRWWSRSSTRSSSATG